MTINIELYRKLYLIREAEKAIRNNYHKNDMKTPMHMSMGEEAIVAGVCQALKHEDQVMGTYRSHGLYLAKTMETDEFFAEMYCKISGCARGKAGSMHLCSPLHGMMGSCAIVSGFIPVAMGLAFANKYLKNNKMTAVFFGDGAIDEGAFWETLNASCLYKLPILFVCEDNGLAVHTEHEMRHGYKSINEIVKQFECNVFETDSTDAEDIYNLTQQALAQNQKDGRPCFMHFHYYRYLEHVGINEDFDANYRSRDKFDIWRQKDPVCILRQRLVDAHIDIDKLEAEINIMIERSIALAEQAPNSDKKELYEGVFSCE